MSGGHANRNVRMRGFSTRVTVDDALDWLDRTVAPLEPESVDLVDANHRWLSCNVVSRIDVPSFDRAAMDGYAVRADETTGCSDYSPVTLKVSGESMPGAPFESRVGPGQAVRVMTGAPLPAGSDAVVPAEFATQTDDHVELTTTVGPGRHVGRRAEDVATGAKLFDAGHRLRPQDVGLLASVGLDRVDVVRRPRVRMVVTGNELIQPGSPRGPFQIFDANSSLLHSLIARDGGTLESRRHVPDEPGAIRRAMTDPGCDVVLVSGGSSVGAEDHAPSVLAESGELPIHGIAMRPSSPTGMGTIGRTIVFLLPGNPVSCLCAYDFFAGRTIRRLGGGSVAWPYPRTCGALKSKIVSTIGRRDYCRVVVQHESIEPIAISGASILSSTTRANGFVIVPDECEGYADGTRIDVFLYDSPR